MHKTELVNTNVVAGKNNSVFFQPKLSINQPNDQYEQEADAVAELIVQSKNINQQNTFFKPVTISSIQKKCPACEHDDEENLQRKEQNNSETEASSELESYISGLGGSGNSLPPQTNQFFSQKIGYDFSNVKIHTDAVAAKSAQSINALAYTTGSNIVFNQNQYQPETDAGKKLLAHELTHVVQQNGMVSRDFKDSDSEELCGGAWKCASKKQCVEPDNPEDGPFESSIYDDDSDPGYIIAVHIDIEEKSLDDVDTEGNVGHTFIEFEELNGAIYTFGFYPNKNYPTPDPSGIMGSRTAPGCVVHPDLTHYGCVDYVETFYVNRGQYLAALGKAQASCAATPQYHILNYNCVTWANEIINESGNSLPNMRGAVYIPLAGELGVDNPNTLYDSLVERDNKLYDKYETNTDNWKFERWPDGTWYDREGRMHMGPGPKW
ncbi:MAG: DUF4157 domain-containing protein [Chitinophagales bacterium]